MPDRLPASTFARVLRLAALVLCLAPVPRLAHGQADTYRQWTSVDGRKLEAALVAVEGDVVKLKLRTGAVVSVPLIQLSYADNLILKPAAPPDPAETPDSPPMTSPPAKAVSPAYAAEKTWPHLVAVADILPVTVVKEDAAAKEFIYRSEHFVFHCDSKLSVAVVKEFNRLFEATYMLSCKLPLDLRPVPENGQEFFMARLFTKDADYIETSGFQNANGGYTHNTVMAPLSSLGVKVVGSRVTLEKGKDEAYSSLTEALSFQMLNRWGSRLPKWYTYGSAGYVSILKYDKGRFSLTGLGERMRAFLQTRGGSGRHFEMLDLDELTHINAGLWSHVQDVDVPQARQNYASALLLTYYFYHLDDKGDAAHMIDFLKATEVAKSSEQLREAFTVHLLRERTYDVLKADVKRGLKKEGLDIDFSPPGNNKAAALRSK